MELGLFIIFWYGVSHAFGPDHLTAIADFSIGRDTKKTLMVVGAFAQLLHFFVIPQRITDYGDLIASSVLFGIGLYLLYMVYANKIHLHTHIHNDQKHIHIWFGNEHDHPSSFTGGRSAFGIGVLMGIGGVRGMLVTLGMLQGQSIDAWMIVAFIAGVMVVFLTFGWVILWINNDILTNIKNVRRAFTTVGILSLLVSGNMLFG